MKWRLWVYMLAVAMLLTGCNLVVPGQPPQRWCYPAKSWRCHPSVHIGLV